MLGILLLSGILFGILNSLPALEKPDYLTTLSTMETRVLTAVFFQAAMAVVYVCVAALFYPMVKQHSEGLAAGYLGFRIIGAAFLFAGIGSLLLLLWLSRSYVSAGQTGTAYFTTAGELLRRGRDILNHIGMILPWSTGGLILYYTLYRTRHIPRWLAVWGLIGSALTLLATLMLMLDIIQIVTPAYFVLNGPTALFEVTLSLFLIIRGFSPVYPIDLKSQEKGREK